MKGSYADLRTVCKAQGQLCQLAVKKKNRIKKKTHYKGGEMTGDGSLHQLFTMNTFQCLILPVLHYIFRSY